MARREKMDRDLVRIATTVVLGALAVVFDTTIVGVALHTLADELGATVDQIQWVSTGYLLALGVTIPVAGWAQSRLGGKRLWIAALIVFLLASILCSLAWDATSLVVFRILQGVGGGILLPLMPTLVVQAAQGKDLGRLMATMSLPSVLGPIFGPVLGGLILGSLSWHWLFLVNVPFCVIGLVCAFVMLPPDRARGSGRLDLPGLLLLSPALVGMLYGLTNVTRDGGLTRADVLVPIAGGVVLLAAFAGWAANRSGAALVDVRLLGHRPLAASAILLFLSGFALYGALLLFPLYWQEVRGASALGAGLLLIPEGIGTFLSRSLAGRLTDEFGARWVVLVGFLIVALSTVPFALAGTTTSEGVLMAALLVRGIGLGAVTIPLMSTAYVGMAANAVPHASIITRIASQIGGAFGVAVLALILQASSSNPGILGVSTTAFDHAFWWAIGFTALAVPLSLLVPANGLPRRTGRTRLIRPRRRDRSGRR